MFQLSTVLPKFRSHWNTLVLIGAWLFSYVGGFLLAPPVGSYDAYERSLARFGQFVMTAFAGLIILVCSRYPRRKDSTRWGITAATGLIVCLSLYAVFVSLSVSYSCNYNNGRIIIGTDADLTRTASEYKRNNPDITNEELVMDFAGEVEAIWTPASMEWRRQKLAALYIFCLPFFALTIMSLVQAFICRTPKKSVDAANSAANDSSPGQDEYRQPSGKK